MIEYERQAYLYLLRKGWINRNQYNKIMEVNFGQVDYSYEKGKRHKKLCPLRRTG